MVDRVSEKFVLARSSVDERSETLANARYIGLLRNNFTRLNVASALDNANDREDNFSFSVQTKGTLGMAYTTNEEVNMRFRLLERSTGRLIADSGAAEGSELKQRFDDLQANKLDVKPKLYVLKVDRAVGESRTKEPNYVIQLSMGKTFKFDYETVERPAGRNTTNVIPTSTVITGMLTSKAPGSFIDVGASALNILA